MQKSSMSNTRGRAALEHDGAERGVARRSIQIQTRIHTITPLKRNLNPIPPLQIPHPLLARGPLAREARAPQRRDVQLAIEPRDRLEGRTLEVRLEHPAR